MKNYEDFEMVIGKVGDLKVYSVTVSKACGGKLGDADGAFRLEEITDVEPDAGAAVDSPVLARNVMILDKEGGNAGGQKKDLNFTPTNPLQPDAARAYGNRLREALFKPKIAELFGAAKKLSRDANSALRIRLDLTRAPELAVLPWEYLRTTDDSNFVGLDIDTTLVRYLSGSEAVRPLRVIPPLRILVMKSSPKDQAMLDVNMEADKIMEALKQLNNDIRNVEIVPLEKATFTGLKAALNEAHVNDKPFHVFHFIGHGSFDEESGKGFLLFEDDDGNGSAVDHDALGRLLQPYRTDLRLAVLNACEGARLSISDSYSSVAAKLIDVAEIPAVIAMQFAVTDAAAIIFAEAFYRQLAGGESLERAVDVARLEIDNPDNYHRLNKPMRAEKEWATPVFYLRSTNGFLFEVKVPTALPHLRTHYEDLDMLLKRSYLVIFLGLEVNLLNRPYFDPWEPEKGLPSAAELCAYLSRLLKINPPRDSLARLATQLKLNGENPSQTFRAVFKNMDKPSKLHEVLGQITQKITAALPEEVTDPCHCSILFVTTTYDFALENAFRKAGIIEFDTITYAKNQDDNWIFFHNRYRDNPGEANHLNNPAEVTPLVEPHTPNKYEGLRNRSPVILKLPGEMPRDLLNDSGFAITEDDFFNFAHKELATLLPADLLGQINSSVHLYIGYDLQNWTLRLLWNRICENQSPKRRQGSSAVVSDSEEDPNVAFWNEYKVNRVPASLDDYVAGLEEYILRRL